MTDYEQDLLIPLRNNDPVAVFQFLEQHYRNLGKESLKGMTPNIDLSRYWRGIASIVSSAKNKIKKEADLL